MSQLADSLMSIFGFKRVTCASCEHSRFNVTAEGGKLWCETKQRPAEALCEAYCYAPGTDEIEGQNVQ